MQEHHQHSRRYGQQSLNTKEHTLKVVSTNYNGGAAPMDIGATSKGKYKGKGKGKHEGKKGKKGNKGTGYGSYGQHQQGNYTSHSTKGKGKVGQGTPFKGQHDKGRGKSYNKSTGHGKGRIVLLQVWTTRSHHELQSFSAQAMAIQHQ